MSKRRSITTLLLALCAAGIPAQGEPGADIARQLREAAERVRKADLTPAEREQVGQVLKLLQDKLGRPGRVVATLDDVTDQASEERQDRNRARAAVRARARAAADDPERAEVFEVVLRDGARGAGSEEAMVVRLRDLAEAEKAAGEAARRAQVDVQRIVLDGAKARRAQHEEIEVLLERARDQAQAAGESAGHRALLEFARQRQGKEPERRRDRGEEREHEHGEEHEHETRFERDVARAAFGAQDPELLEMIRRVRAEVREVRELVEQIRRRLDAEESTPAPSRLRGRLPGAAPAGPIRVRALRGAEDTAGPTPPRFRGGLVAPAAPESAGPQPPRAGLFRLRATEAVPAPAAPEATPAPPQPPRRVRRATAPAVEVKVETGKGPELRLGEVIAEPVLAEPEIRVFEVAEEPLAEPVPPVEEVLRPVRGVVAPEPAAAPKATTPSPWRLREIR